MEGEKKKQTNKRTQMALAEFCCRTAEVAKAKQLEMRIQGMQSTRHRAEPPLKQSQVALKMSEQGITAGSAIPTWTEPKEMQNK